jgi:glutathione S-transferase
MVAGHQPRGSAAVLKLYDYKPSQNAWKVRQLLQHLQRPYSTEYISIFAGEGQTEAYRRINPTGAVPAIQLEDGRVLAESNAILFYLATGTPYLPADPFGQAKVLQWLSFEGDYVQATIATLRHWTMTGKVAARADSLVAAKRAGSLKVLEILERALSETPFIAGDDYSIADISLFSYVHLAGDAGLPLDGYPNLRNWIDRVRAQPGFLSQVFPYAIDPLSGAELP